MSRALYITGLAFLPDMALLGLPWVDAGGCMALIALAVLFISARIATCFAIVSMAQRWELEPS